MFQVSECCKFLFIILMECICQDDKQSKVIGGKCNTAFSFRWNVGVVCQGSS